MLDADAYCGLVGIFTSTSESIRSVVEFKSSAMSGAKFSCTLTTVVDQCTCGKKNVGRIVGGVVVGDLKFTNLDFTGNFCRLKSMNFR